MKKKKLTSLLQLIKLITYLNYGANGSTIALIIEIYKNQQFGLFLYLYLLPHWGRVYFCRHFFFLSVLFIPFFDDCFNEAPSSEAFLMCGRKKKCVCVCVCGSVGRVTPVNPNCPSHMFMSFSCWWGVRWRDINRFTHMELLALHVYFTIMATRVIW